MSAVHGCFLDLPMLHDAVAPSAFFSLFHYEWYVQHKDRHRCVRRWRSRLTGSEGHGVDH